MASYWFTRITCEALGCQHALDVGKPLHQVKKNFCHGNVFPSHRLLYLLFLIVLHFQIYYRNKVFFDMANILFIYILVPGLQLVYKTDPMTACAYYPVNSLTKHFLLTFLKIGIKGGN